MSTKAANVKLIKDGVKYTNNINLKRKQLDNYIKKKRFLPSFAGSRYAWIVSSQLTTRLSDHLH